MTWKRRKEPEKDVDKEGSIKKERHKTGTSLEEEKRGG